MDVPDFVIEAFPDDSAEGSHVKFLLAVRGALHGVALDPHHQGRPEALPQPHSVRQAPHARANLAVFYAPDAGTHHRSPNQEIGKNGMLILALTAMHL